MTLSTNKLTLVQSASISLGVSALAVVLGISACSSTSDSLPVQVNRVKTNNIQEIAMMSPEQYPAVLKERKRVEADMVFADASLPLAPQNTENYHHEPENRVKVVAQQPVSTFSVDVDTGSYTNSRRILNDGLMPPSDAVRIEEFINYFNYQYPLPNDQSVPFTVNTDVAESPWNKERHIMRIGLKGFVPPHNDLGSNLVFLLDVSGSMDQPNKLGLLKKSLSLLTDQLTNKDSVSIVVYAGASGVVLAPTKGDKKVEIQRALSNLRAGGSTNGAAGIELAYQLASQQFIEGGINRVILATDGDFNVGTVNHNQLIDLIKRKRARGIALTTLGFGKGNYNDHLMEQLADAGNGQYAYIDTLNEARKVLVDELSATMQMIAKDVKVQVEFNPALVEEYRLIGYENRVLDTEDFNNDNVDAGDIGAGHSVTALYELTLSSSDAKFNPKLRYQKPPEGDSVINTEELAYVKLRYKQPDEDTSKAINVIVNKNMITKFSDQSDDFKFATAVVGFAQLLKQSKYATQQYDDVINLANKVKGDDEFGYRAEFVQLVRTARLLADRQAKADMLPQQFESTQAFVEGEVKEFAKAYLAH